jgi:hypothetical protein
MIKRFLINLSLPLIVIAPPFCMFTFIDLGTRITYWFQANVTAPLILRLGDKTVTMIYLLTGLFIASLIYAIIMTYAFTLNEKESESDH